MASALARGRSRSPAGETIPGGEGARTRRRGRCRECRMGWRSFGGRVTFGPYGPVYGSTRRPRRASGESPCRTGISRRIPASCRRFEKEVHYFDFQQTVPLAIEVQQCALHDRGDSIVAQPARTMSLICVAFDSFAQLRAAGIVGVFLTGELQLGSPPRHDFGGDRIGQTEGDELYGAGLVEMGEVASAVPRLGRVGRGQGHVVWWRCSSGPTARCGRDARAPKGSAPRGR